MTDDEFDYEIWLRTALALVEELAARRLDTLLQAAEQDRPMVVVLNDMLEHAEFGGLHLDAPDWALCELLEILGDLDSLPHVLDQAEAALRFFIGRRLAALAGENEAEEATATPGEWM